MNATFHSQNEDYSLTRRPNQTAKYSNCSNKSGGLCEFHVDGDGLVSGVVPAVTVVVEGRSICRRISLHKHGSYKSLAKALRQMFVEDKDDDDDGDDDDGAGGGRGGTTSEDIDLMSNAIPGHLVAYEDMENDLLLAGDLNWKDFVRVAKRIQILPAKGNRRNGTRVA